MDIRKLARADLKHENGLDAQRLLPWATLNAPFEGSWCVVRPFTASTPHAHHEYEIFVAVSGEAVVDADGEQRPFLAGDIVFLPPGVMHQVINQSTTDFEMYSVWWDLEMAERFAQRHQRQEG
jgi:mannose-6-phosphate isomerase-like protein (cupin superfamily)